MRYLLLLTVIFAFSLASAQTAENEQTSEVNKRFLSLTFSYYRAKDFYDENGRKKPIGCTFEKKEFQVYGEYRFNEQTKMILKLPFSSLSCGADKSSGFSDFEIGFTKGIKKSRKFAFYGNVIFPTGYSIKDNLRLGYGRIGLEGGALLNVSGKNGFMSTNLGYRHYFGYPSSQIRSYTITGLKVTKKIQLINALDIQLGLRNGKRKPVGRNIILEPDYKLAQFYTGPRIIFKNLSFVATYQHVFWGRNTGVGRGFNFSLWWEF